MMTTAMAQAKLGRRIARQRVTTPDGRLEDVWALPLDEPYLEAVFRFLFEERYQEFSFGPLIPGAAYELRTPGKPERVSLMDAYLTVHWGARGHFHLCIGETHGPASKPNSPEVVAHRRPGRCELYRKLDEAGLPIVWGLRMSNGRDEPLISIFFPNPYLSTADELLVEPDWTRMRLWEEFLPRFTGETSDGLDRQGRGFGCG